MSKSTSCLSRLYIIVSRAWTSSSLRWCSCSTHRYALSLSFWRQVNSADACTWCHHDLVWEEASKVWYVHSPLHTLVMCRNKIIRRLTRATLQVILASLRMVRQPVSIPHNSISAQGKEGRICHAHCLDDLIPLIPILSLLFSARPVSRELEHNGSKPNVYAELHFQAFQGKYGTLFSVNVLIAKN